MDNSTGSFTGFAEDGGAAKVGALPGSFVIECQRHWPGTSNLICFATSGALRLVWCAYPAVLRQLLTRIPA